MQILANQAPIGFEAEFVNQRGTSILYRGILLPFSSNDETIDFICGVINWKEIADAATADELLLEIDQAIDGGEHHEPEPVRHHSHPMTDWADSPASEANEPSEADGVEAVSSEADGFAANDGDDPAYDEPATGLFGRKGFGGLAASSGAANGRATMPDFEQYALDSYGEDEEEYDEEEGEDDSSYGFASLADYIEAPAKKALDLDAEDYAIEEEDFDEGGFQPAPGPFALDDVPAPIALAELDENAGLFECLASARELARTATTTEDRSRQALYAAVGRAYDVSLAAIEAPEEYEALIEESGLAVQDRAPMTPVVKLVFGNDYDKTRLTEYAAVLSHAHRLELGRGSLATFLAEAEGGLKGVVKAERRLRREESGKEPLPQRELRAALAKKLRELEALTLAAIEGHGPEFALVMIRRDGEGNVALLGEIEEDIGLVERAAKRLVG
jgi:hypothetical protein